MKGYRTTRDFARAVSRETGHAPKFTCYELEDRQHARRFQQRAPNSYHGLRRATFWADVRCVTRRFGTWVESAEEGDVTWLMQRQLREAVDRLRDRDLQCLSRSRPATSIPRSNGSSTAISATQGGTCTGSPTRR